MEMSLSSFRIQRPAFLFPAVLGGAGFYVFYAKYLLPVFALPAFHNRWGTLVLIFFLPFINNFPYFGLWINPFRPTEIPYSRALS